MKKTKELEEALVKEIEEWRKPPNPPKPPESKLVRDGSRLDRYLLMGGFLLLVITPVSLQVLYSMGVIK